MEKEVLDFAKIGPSTVGTAVKKMKPRNYFGDALTAVSLNIISNMAGIITYFYTDVVGLAVGAVGTVILLSKLADAFTDIGMGILVDKTKSRYGMARPWLLWMAVPSTIGIVLLFTVPSGVGTGFQLVYAAVTNMLLLAGVYTAIAIPVGSLLSLETSNPNERAKMGIWRLVFAYAAGTSISLLFPATNRLGGGQAAWIAVSLIYGVVAAGSLVMSFFMVKENNLVQPQKEEEISPLKGTGLLFKNKYWLIALSVNVFIQVIYAMNAAGTTYYMKHILGDENLMVAVSIYRLVSMAAGLILSGFFIKRLGKRNMILAGVLISVAGCALRLINPYNLSLNLAAIGVSALGDAPLLAVIGAMIADTIEYGEWKTGVRMVGLTSSANSFAGKLGGALFAGVAGWLLGLSGYNGVATEQPVTAIKMIMTLNIHIPLICYAVIFVLMLFYNLDKDYNRIMSELEYRRSAG